MSTYDPANLIPVLLLAAMLGGCSEPPPPPPTPDPDLEMAAVRQEAARANDLLLQRVSALENDLAHVRQAAKEDLAECEQRVLLNDRRAQELEQDLKDEQAVSRRLRAELEKIKSARPPIVMAPGVPGTAADFPVEVFDVSGKEVIIDVRTRPRAVEMEETYRDSYGNKKPVITWESVTVNDYEYQTVFSVRNRTDQPVTIHAKAGVDTESIDVPPDGVLTNITLRSAPGSSLFIEAAGETRRFDVDY